MPRPKRPTARTPAGAPTQRQLRVGEALRHALAEILNRGELRDPDLVGRSITVSEVRIGPDLKTATAFVLPLGGEDATAIVAALNRAAPHLRGRLGRVLNLKFAPKVRFAADVSFDHVLRMEQILSALPESERADGPAPSDAPEPPDLESDGDREERG